MKFILLTVILFLSLCSSILFAQPLADMHVAKYNDNETPYPIYAGLFATHPKWNDDELIKLAACFDALYGAYEGFDSSKVAVVRSVNNDFQFLRYVGSWTLENSSLRGGDVERDYYNEIMYYRLGNLANSLGINDTVIILSDVYGAIMPSTADDTAKISYKVDGNWKYVTWLCIDGEYMRIKGVDGNTVQVERGFKASKKTSHSSNLPVIVPVYGRSLNSNRLTFRHDEASELRWRLIFNHLVKEYELTGGGVWIDIIIGNLSVSTMDGLEVPKDRVWNRLENRAYLFDERTMYAGKGVKLMQELFHQKFNKYPVVWGNNMMFPKTLSDERIGLLIQTPEKPRPIDGFALENSFGAYGYGGNSGKEYHEVSFDEWVDHVKSIMFLGEQKLSACPLSFDGGIDNAKLAAEPYGFRHRLQLYAYASYLMGVKVEANDAIYTKFGLTPIIAINPDSIHLSVEPFLKWPIGRPVETRLSSDIEGYKLKDSILFVRKFENGIVIVNPSDSIFADIDLDKIHRKTRFVNPDKNYEAVEKITMQPKSGAILLFKNAVKH